MTDIALTDIEEKESLSLSRRLDLAAQSLNKAVVGVLAVPYAVTDALNFGSQKLFGTKVYDGPSYEEAKKEKEPFKQKLYELSVMLGAAQSSGDIRETGL